MSILDGIEKIDEDDVECFNDTDEPEKLALVISYKGDEFESFILDAKTAKETIKQIMDILTTGKTLPFTVFLHNSQPKPGEARFEIGDNVSDFRGIIRIDKDVRAIRLVDPKGLQ